MPPLLFVRMTKFDNHSASQGGRIVGKGASTFVLEEVSFGTIFLQGKLTISVKGQKKTLL